MSLRIFLRTAIASCAVSLACLAPSGAMAQSQDDELKYQLTIYGWFPGIGGTTAFPTQTGSDFNVSAENVIDSLKFGVMGTFGIKQGAWGLWTDLMWSNLGGSKDGTRDFTIGSDAQPASVSGNLSLDVKTTLWTLAGSYELGQSPDYTADLLFGARLLNVKDTLEWTLNGDMSGVSRSGSAEVDASLWDAIIGIKGMVYLGGERTWFIPYYLDVGTGQSDLTWQADTGIGYRFGWGALTATWRYLDYEMKSGEPLQSLNFNGAMLGATFQW